MRILAQIFYVVSTVVVCGLGSGVFASGHIEFGPADAMTIDQPRVTVEVYIPEPEHSFGPDISNYWLLDTGAQSILAAQTATDEMTSQGYETSGTFVESGIGGSTTYDVSKTYNVDFAGTNGSRNTLADVQILSSTTANYGGFGGIIGTPAMVNRVTNIDLPAMLTDFQLGVSFSAAAPAGFGHRYSVPLEFKHFGHSDLTDPPTTLPTYKPLPFVTTEARHSGNSVSGGFVLDTGAQLSMLSTHLAFALGLDTDGDGNFDNEKVDDFPLSGAGGTTTAPVLFIDKIVLPTTQGVDLIWTDLNLPVLDIDPSIDGIFGNDLLTSGWFDPVFNSTLDQPSTQHGYIDYVHFDFTDSDNLNGTMLLDINPVYDNVVPDPVVLLPGDANGDGVVSASDYAAVQMNFGTVGSAGVTGDANGDGVVSASDYASVQADFGNVAPSLTIPEPATIFLLGFGIVGILYKRK